MRHRRACVPMRRHRRVVAVVVDSVIARTVLRPVTGRFGPCPLFGQIASGDPRSTRDPRTSSTRGAQASRPPPRASRSARGDPQRTGARSAHSPRGSPCFRAQPPPWPRAPTPLRSRVRLGGAREAARFGGGREPAPRVPARAPPPALSKVQASSARGLEGAKLAANVISCCSPEPAGALAGPRRGDDAGSGEPKHGSPARRAPGDGRGRLRAG